MLRPDQEIWLLAHDYIISLKAQRILLLSQLTKKFGDLIPELEHEILNLNGPNIDRLALALLDMNTLDTLTSWLVKADPYFRRQAADHL